MGVSSRAKLQAVIDPRTGKPNKANMSKQPYESSLNDRIIDSQDQWAGGNAKYNMPINSREYVLQG